ncbi:hypothetical protein CBS101457_003249 [Exobasidium rhododendri]|nr:hypothetical protein CBS101457_003249 [Exobasidium rhododendri]
MDLVREASDKIFSSLGAYRHSYSKVGGFRLLDKDPVLEAARYLGFKVVEYDLPVYPVEKMFRVGNELLAFMIFSTFVCYMLYFYVAKTPLLKWASVGAMISMLMAWPAVTGTSGVMLLDFWKPALGFRSCLLVWDIFHIRTREEVESWSIPRFYCHLWAFPKEEEEIAEREEKEGFKRNAVWENAKGMPRVVVEGVLLLLSLYFVPTYELTKNMSQLAYHCYCDMLGVSILMALALFGDGLLKVFGMVCNVEMQDMFENPLGTINIRLFWSHWNRAIASVLHRVVFGGGRRTKSKAQVETKKEAKPPSNSKRLEALKKRQHLDHLSETEHESSKTDDEDEARKSRSRSDLKMTPSNGTAANGGSKKASDLSSAEKEKKMRARGKSSFLPKAAAAIATFAMSGLFHEHITYFTFDYADGKNFLFFLANGFATVISTWFKRTYPEANARIPTWAAVLLLHTFFLAVVPLFCTPFIRRGFFTQMEGLKYELLPIAPRKAGSFIYLFGQ